jgi:tetratricopeptide (TPR) repeat protein
VEAYRAAAKVNPKAGEPLYRIGTLLHSFYFDCQADHLSPLPLTCADPRKELKARDIVNAWDEFEARTPLDPRVNDLLLERAIMRTKLLAAFPTEKTLLEGALRDYQSLLDRTGGLLKKPSSLVLGNLAETYMMLGQLDEAIETYQLALRAGGHASVVYGLAVALDRDDPKRTPTALDLIRERGYQEFEDFESAFHRSDVFFVPAGEQHYYFALANEAFGNYSEAAQEWKAFIQSGAHPQFQPRAKQHLDALLGKKFQRWRPPPSPDSLLGPPP